MKVRLISLLMLLPTLTSCGPADNDPLKRDVKAKVQLLNDATIRGEYGKVADLTHPKIIELAGGREELIDYFEKTSQKMKSEGIEVRSGQVGEPAEIVQEGSELFVVVPFDLTLKYRDGVRTTHGYVIGVSTDAGKRWAFVNSPTDKSLKLVLPNLPGALKLPPARPPTSWKE